MRYSSFNLNFNWGLFFYCDLDRNLNLNFIEGWVIHKNLLRQLNYFWNFNDPFNSHLSGNLCYFKHGSFNNYTFFNYFGYFNNLLYDSRNNNDLFLYLLHYLYSGYFDDFFDNFFFDAFLNFDNLFLNNDGDRDFDFNFFDNILF